MERKLYSAREHTGHAKHEGAKCTQGTKVLETWNLMQSTIKGGCYGKFRI